MVLGFMVFISTAADATTLTFYNDRATFDADFPDLPLEDFEEGTLPNARVRGCSRPVDENTDNRCFVPGDIEPGVSFTTPTSSGIALYGAGFGGATSKNIIANRAKDFLIIDFTAGDVTAVGMDITAYFDGDPNVQIDIFGANGLLGTTTAADTTASGSFWGVSSDEVITQIVLTSNLGKSEGVDNIAFGPDNKAPDCSNGAPSADSLWPPNHKMANINVEGVVDPDADPVTINIDSIWQDEVVNGEGDGDTTPDGGGVGTDTAQVRAERSGQGDGRVYQIFYTASDDKGAECTSSVHVGVPHDKKDTAVNSGTTENSIP